VFQLSIFTSRHQPLAENRNARIENIKMYVLGRLFISRSRI